MGTCIRRFWPRSAWKAGVLELVRQYERRWGIQIDCDLEEVGRPESQALLYRAAREPLANAYKHPKATRMLIDLRNTRDGIMLRIADNGVGFDLEAPTPAWRRATSGCRRWWWASRPCRAWSSSR